MSEVPLYGGVDSILKIYPFEDLKLTFHGESW